MEEISSVSSASSERNDLEELSNSSENDEFFDLFNSTSSSSTSSGASGASGREEKSFAAQTHVSVENFVDTIMEYSEADFKSHFRLKKETALILVDLYEENLTHYTVERIRVGAQKEIFMFLWYMANTVTFRQLSNLFGVTKSTAWKTIVNVSNWIVTIAHLYIRWPAPNDIRNVSKKFKKKRNIPNVIGAIDGSHIKIRAPNQHPRDFFNRKKYYSISIQAVVDADKRFIDIHCGEPGSMHDARVLKRSKLYHKAYENVESLFPKNKYVFTWRLSLSFVALVNSTI